MTHDLNLLSRDDLILLIEDLQTQIIQLSRSANRPLERVMDDLLHEHKNELFTLLRSMEEAQTSSPGRSRKILEEQVSWIRRRIHQLQSTFAPPTHISVDVNLIIRKVVRIFTLEQRGKTISFSCEYHPMLPNIMASEEEIRAVIFNLISNAVKAVKKANRKQGKINISTGIIEERKIEYIQATVEDNGIGIKNEDVRLVFEKGFTTYEGGVGMGLFISESIVKGYGGKIGCESTVGKGTKFSIFIPLRRNQS